MDEKEINVNLAKDGQYMSSFECQGGFYGNPEESDENGEVISGVLVSLLALANIPFMFGILVMLMVAIVHFCGVPLGSLQKYFKYWWILPVVLVNLWVMVKGYSDDKKYFLIGYILTAAVYYVLFVQYGSY